MEILKLLQERHTTKKYDASRKISDADFDLLLESLRLAPSSVNSQPWEFFIADTKEAKEKLLPAIADFNHSRVTDSDRLIVCAIHTDLDETYLQDLDDQEEADGRYQDPAYKVDNGQRRRFFVGKYRDAGEIACWAGRLTLLRASCSTPQPLSVFIPRRSKVGTPTRLTKFSACAKRACTPSTP